MKVLLITRPRGQARPLAHVAQQKGWQTVCLPLFAVANIGSDADRREALEARADAHWWIFTSVNAVAAARRAAPARWARCAAIGAATARALDEAGHPVEAMPEESYSTEALLALPEFQEVADQHIVIIGNETARPALREQLEAGGARVEALAVYRLESIPHSAAEVAEAVQGVGVTVLTSASAADRLWELADGSTRRRLAHMPLVVPSERVAEHCTRHGMNGPHAVAQPMSNAALLAAADTLPIMQKNDDEAQHEPTHTAPPAIEPAIEPAATPAPQPATEDGVEGPPGSASADQAPEGPEPPAAPPAPPAAPPPRRRGGLWVLLLFCLLLLGGAAAAGWWGWQELQSMKGASAERAQRAEALEQRLAEQGETARSARRSASDAVGLAGSLEEQLATLDERVAAQSERLGELSDVVDAGRAQAHIVAAEQLLMAASERLQLGRDPEGARRALQLADQRLATLEDPRFFGVREALASEMAALRAVEAVDRTAMALELHALIARAGDWRLLGGVPDTSAPALPEQSQGAEALPAWQRALASVREALSSVFVVRRTDEPVRPLMAPEQAGIVRSILLLRLESARAALLAGEAEAFDSALSAAVSWLEKRYARGDADVSAAVATLEELRGRELRPALPDISGSLRLLREATSESGNR
jgi:uroporphyrinogen III methyltransferase/synthase